MRTQATLDFQRAITIISDYSPGITIESAVSLFYALERAIVQADPSPVFADANYIEWGLNNEVIRDYCFRGLKIQAIKEMRQRMTNNVDPDNGLKRAKDLIEIVFDRLLTP